MGGHGWAWFAADGYGLGMGTKFEGKCWALLVTPTEDEIGSLRWGKPNWRKFIKDIILQSDAEVLQRETGC